ncbi:hypothetical protein GGR16_000752 [Chelatococcus caeni]|uniref:Uncharacterized protein n=1 Tax=Chelatococcus caeni TaxID=1348468 RepID=A0A840BY98_9HYPH|nr:hypothetical protein [Chelatococcus caeni]MBB4015746.1 hypothetical protein [Chelatococcus caeni]
MKRLLLLFCCLLVGACNQTSTPDAGVPAGARVAASAPAETPRRGKRNAAEIERACMEAANKAAEAQTGAAVIGSALSLVGGFGGFGGRGGMIAAQAASTGGSLIQSHAGRQARATMADCYD